MHSIVLQLQLLQLHLRYTAFKKLENAKVYGLHQGNYLSN